MLNVDFYFTSQSSFSALSFSHKNLIIFHNKQEHFTFSDVIQCSASYFCSDCEVNDVVELAKDERLADKLYTETLRALKLDAI